MEKIMKIDKLKEIVLLADKSAIVRKLKALGYEDARKNETYRNFSLEKIVRGEQEETEWINRENRFEYNGRIYTNVEGAEQAEFIAICINKISKDGETSLPYALLWFVKEE